MLCLSAFPPSPLSLSLSLSRANKHTRARAHTQTFKRVLARARAYTHTHTHTHAHAHTRTHACTHIHTRARKGANTDDSWSSLLLPGLLNPCLIAYTLYLKASLSQSLTKLTYSSSYLRIQLPYQEHIVDMNESWWAFTWLPKAVNHTFGSFIQSILHILSFGQPFDCLVFQVPVVIV